MVFSKPRTSKPNMSKILITGATGHLGLEAVKQLVEKQGADNVYALVRDLAKAAPLTELGVSLVMADYNDYASLVQAFEGVDKLYFVSSSDVMNRAKHHENVVRAATESKVGHIIYTSYQRKTEDGSSPIAFIAAPHLLAEKLILESGLTYTILRHALYSDVLPMFLGEQILETGVIFLPAGDGKAAFATRNDMATAGVEIISGTGHENKIYDISCGESYSMADVAEILSELSGKTIQYAAPDQQSFVDALTQAGVPQEGIQGAATFCQAIAQGEFDFPDNTLERLIGREPESLKAYLAKAYKL
jgi:NAD(P)H dehydrogenase (quinone)